MNNIFYENNSDSTQDRTEIALQVFEALMQGKPFNLIVDDGDGDIRSHTVEISTNSATYN